MNVWNREDFTQFGTDGLRKEPHRNMSMSEKRFTMFPYLARKIRHSLQFVDFDLLSYVFCNPLIEN